MTLFIGTSPFGPSPRGEWSGGFSVPDHVVWFEDSPRRVRGIFNGETVVDTRRAKLLHESRHLPRWYFPMEDVRMDFLEPAERHTHCPVKGEASYWTLRVGDREAENAMWSYPEPIAGSEFLAGYASFYLDRLDKWLEEDEEALVHPRDPYHRVDVMRTSRPVRVSFDGRVLAETTRAVALFETALPPRWYIPPEDVDFSSLHEEPRLETSCPYKGTTSMYWSADGDGGLGLAWCYSDPLPAVAAITGRVCFFSERAQVEVDGELQRDPETQWDTDGWVRRALAAA